MTWQQDKRWSDRFLPEIKRILGEHLIGEPPIEEDAERNTDLMVLRMEAVRIGCRVRRHSQFKLTYPEEFTIRAGRPSGVKTELTKIIEGWGQYFLYGFAAEDNSSLCRWTLADLNVFRYWFNRYLANNKGKAPGMRKPNHDGSSDFLVFRWDALPPEFVVGRNWEEREAA